jgi:hypothetical protein
MKKSSKGLILRQMIILSIILFLTLVIGVSTLSAQTKFRVKISNTRKYPQLMKV